METPQALDSVEPGSKITIPDKLDLYEHFRLTKTELQVVGTPTFDEWVAMGSTLRFFEVCIQFALGDWLNVGEGTWGDKVAQVVDVTDFSIETIRNYAWVAGKVPPSNRVEGLPFTFHQAVAAMSTPEQRLWLAKTQEQGWSVADLKREIKKKMLGAPDLAVRYLVVVECRDEDDQQTCARQLENLERTYTLKTDTKAH